MYLSKRPGDSSSCFGNDVGLLFSHRHHSPLPFRRARDAFFAAVVPSLAWLAEDVSCAAAATLLGRLCGLDAHAAVNLVGQGVREEDEAGLSSRCPLPARPRDQRSIRSPGRAALSSFSPA